MANNDENLFISLLAVKPKKEYDTIFI